MPDVPFTIIVPTAYGQMLLNRHDINQTNALVKTGLAVDHNDIALLAQLIPLLGTDVTVLDIGANFGVFTLALARCVGPRGKVHAFEPQRVLFHMLAGSVALNSLTNVFCHHLAVGDREGSVEIPQFDYSQPLNFGSIEFTAEQREPLNQQRRHDPARAEYVALSTIDRLALPQVHLMKIDAEGMELQVLIGAAQTLRRCRPVLYLEFLKSDKAALRQFVTGLQYDVHENGINFLCIPAEMRERIRITQGQPGGVPR